MGRNPPRLGGTSCPIILRLQTTVLCYYPLKNIFQEPQSFILKHTGCICRVLWSVFRVRGSKPIASSQNALKSLDIKLARTAKALVSWAHSLIPQGKLAACICREVIARLEAAHEQRTLSNVEHSLGKLLKSKILGLTAIEHSTVR
jgi:hypothetical protein